MTSGTGAVFSSRSMGINGGGQARSPRSPVSAAASNPLERLAQLDLSASSSPRLQRRAASPPERAPAPPSENDIMGSLRNSCAHEIERWDLTPELREWLTKQGWNSEDLEDLAIDAARQEPELRNEFMLTLCDQAVSNQNRVVFGEVPDPIIALFKEELISSIGNYRGLLLLVPPANEPDPPIPPEGTENLPFLDPQEREANRDLYFPQGSLKMNPALSGWLKQSDSAKYFSDLTNKVGSEFVTGLTNHALALQAFRMIQSIPRDQAAIVRDCVYQELEIENGMLEFVEQEQSNKK